MSISHSIFKGLFWKAIFYASVFLLNFCIARYFEASFSGLIFYITNLCSLLLLILSFSIESGMTYFSSRDEISSPGISSIALLWTGASALLMTTGLLFFHFPARLEIAGNMPVVSLLFISGMLLLTFFSALLAGKKDFKTAFVCQSTGNIILVLILIAGNHYNYAFLQGNFFIYWYFGSFLAEGIFITLYFFYQHHAGMFNFSTLGADIKKLLNYSSVVFISNIIYFLLYRIDYWFVEYFCDDKALGNYVQVSKIAQLLVLVPSTISVVIFPYIAQKGKGGFLPELQLLSRVMLAVFLAICVGASLIGYWLFPFLLGPTFDQMFIPFLLLIPGILSLVSLYPYTSYYAGVDLAKRNVTGTLIGLLVVVVLDILLIPRFGIKGAALASSIGYLCFQFYIMRAFKKDFGVSLRKSFLVQKHDIVKVLALGNKKV